LAYGHILAAKEHGDFAREYFKKAADQGNADGQYMYASYLPQSDHAEALEYYRLAAAQGHAKAQVLLGTFIFHESPAEGAELFRLAAEQGEMQGIINYGSCLMNGAGVPEDMEAASPFVEKAAQSGDAQSQYDMFYILLEMKREKEAMVWLTASANQNNSLACYALARYLETGTAWCEKDEAKAREYYKIAADAGYTKALYVYGAFLLEGIGGNKDQVTGADLVRRAADQNYVPAQCLYGVCLTRGMGVKKDVQMAVKYMKLAADQGESAAQYNYGLFIRDGVGMDVDTERAVTYFKMAAEQKFPEAMREYGLALVYGTGVEVNRAEGMKYLEEAAATGDLRANYDLGRLLIAADDLERGCQYLKVAANEDYEGAQPKFKESCSNDQDNL
jgi:TPR repeat protein